MIKSHLLCFISVLWSIVVAVYVFSDNHENQIKDCKSQLSTNRESSDRLDNDLTEAYSAFNVCEGQIFTCEDQLALCREQNQSRENSP